MKTTRIFLFSLLTLAFVLTSCGGFNKVVKGDNYDVKMETAEGLFLEGRSKRKVREDGSIKEKGVGYYGRALTLYEQIYQRYPRIEKGELSYYRMAQCYYAIGDYYLAGYYYNNFVSRFPLSPKAEECLFMTAMCSVKLSPEEDLDQADTEVAINDFQTFVDRYPGSTLVDSCNRVMDRLRFKIETKDYNSVKLYDKMERYKAAGVSAGTFLENYPQSTYGDEIRYIRMKNYYTLATKSIFSKQKERYELVVNDYAEFDAKYKESDYRKRVENYYEKAGLELLLVDEKQQYYELVKSYKKVETKSKAKKIVYLKETLERYRNFVTQFPDSEFIKKANEIGDKSEKELKKLEDKV